MSESFSLQPIGFVRSSFKSPREVPLQGGRATLEVLPRYAEGLEGLENSSHLMVMGFLHRAERDLLKARPMKVDPSAPAKGVFSTRSPARPNPVSLTVVPLLQMGGLLLEVDHLDLMDGTPLLDLKAYCPGWDSVFSAQHKHRALPGAVDEERLAACLGRDLENFMGPVAHEARARWGLAAVLVGSRRLQADPRDTSMKVMVNRVDATTEALMALTGAAFSNGRLEAHHQEAGLRVRFERQGRFVELVAVGEAPPREVAAWAEAFAVKAGPVE